MCVVSVPSSVLIADYLSYSAVAAAGASEPDGIAFDDAALVPRLPFSVVNDDYAAPLPASDAMTLDRSTSMISLLRFDHALVPLLGRGLLASSESEAATLVKCFPHNAVLTAVLAAARTGFVWSPSQFHLIGLNHNVPGLLTTTVNVRRRRRLGMHFDSWDQLPMNMRGRCRYRLSVNVGAGDRFFLFMALTAAGVLAIMKDQVEEGANATDMLRIALQRCPHRVYRLRVPPLWGYVAQTDFVPHDGSTFGAGLFDFSTHTLADFRPRRNYFQMTSFFHISG